MQPHRYYNIMSQHSKNKKNKNDQQFDSGSWYGWYGNQPILILAGGHNGELLHIWNGTADGYCDRHVVKQFKNKKQLGLIVKKLLSSSYQLFTEKEKAIK
eukprot:519368_1